MTYFSIEELTYSATAERYGIDNTPDDGIVVNLCNLIGKILDPLREEYGRPIVVTSGYRCEKLNKKIGGSKKSAHIYGRAADIRSSNYDRELNKKIGDILCAHKDVWPIDQVIFEKCDHRGLPSWIHVAFSRSPRREIIYM